MRLLREELKRQEPHAYNEFGDELHDADSHTKIDLRALARAVMELMD